MYNGLWVVLMKVRFSIRPFRPPLQRSKAAFPTDFITRNRPNVFSYFRTIEDEYFFITGLLNKFESVLGRYHVKREEIELS